MITVEQVANEFQMKPDEVLKESLNVYLKRRLSKVEAEIFLIAKKYGVKDVFELDSKAKKGLVKEEDSYDDYFALDNLEAERDRIKFLLNKI